MLGEALSMLVPQVVGFRFTGALPQGATATDLVLTVTEILRKSVSSASSSSTSGRAFRRSRSPTARRSATWPEYGATCGFFPVDDVTLAYLRLTGRPEEQVALVEAYCKENMLWHEPDEHPTTRRSSSSTSRRRALARRPATAAGPRPARARRSRLSRRSTRSGSRTRTARRPGARGLVPGERPDDQTQQPARAGARPAATATLENNRVPVAGEDHALEHGSVVIAAITSCTNTSNPSV